ncbi:MAG: cytochrome c biogenesis protein CcdA [Phycisphaerae bacterium]
MNNKYLICKMLFLVLLASNLTLAQPAKTIETQSSATLKIEPASVTAGQNITLLVSIPVKPGMHVYGPNVAKPFFATKLVVIEQGPIIWEDAPLYPKISTLDTGGETFSVIEPDHKNNSVVLTLKGKVKSNAKLGRHKITASLTYQMCSQTQCLQPVIGKSLSAMVIVENTGYKSTGDKLLDQSLKQISPTDGFGTSISIFNHRIDLNKAGLWLPLVVAFIAGLLLNIMPCVLPVIPIKILQLTKQAHQENHSPIKLALVFAMGIVTFFAAIGIVAIILKGGFAWGQSFQNPSFIIGICLVLIVLTLGMFDIYQINVPAVIANREIIKKGYLGAFSMGLLAGILSTPCSFGILGAAIAWAQLQTSYVTILCFLTIGIGMASPYVGLSGFPNLIDKIPHTGKWAELFKESMGFVLLAVVAFLVTALPKERILPVILYFIFFSFTIWFWGKALAYRMGWRAKCGRLIIFLAIILIGWRMLRPVEKSLDWKIFNSQTLAEAKSSGRDIVIDFTADWCLNCRTVEYLIFENKAVKESILHGNVVLLRADKTEEKLYIDKALKEWTGQTGIPFTVVLKPNGKKILLPGIYSPNDLITALK